MSEAKHTPGPWMHGEPEQTTPFPSIPIYGGDGFELARIHGNGRTTSGNNARLIAAAPDLLAALEAVLPWLVTCPGNTEAAFHWKAKIATAREAIAKAKGESA